MPKKQYMKCYFGCKTEGPFHRFPKPVYPNMDRYNLWKAVLAPADQSKGDSYIYDNIRICDSHFEDSCRLQSRRLTRTGIPTLNIPSTSQNVFPTMLSHSPNTATITLTQPRRKEENTSRLSGSQRRVLSKKNIKSSKEYHLLKLKLLKLREKCKNQTKRIRAAEKLSKRESFLKIVERLPEPGKIFTGLQLKSSNKKPRGRRYTLEEKILALTIYKQSQKAYSLLRRMFSLPSKSNLQKTLSLMVLKPGINVLIMKNLKKRVKKLSKEQKLCTLIFDEVALSPGLHYDKKKDQIVGFEDFGEKKTNKIADHALVFMIKGIKNKYKQPICFTFCQSTTKSVVLKQLIKTVIKHIHSTGLRVVATVCDQTQTNQSAINSLFEETKQKYLRLEQEYNSMAFEIENLKVFPLYDPPHLLKGMRNNLLTKELRFVHNGEVKYAKWEHLQMLLDIDVGEFEIRLVNKLTEQHVNKDKIPKMKVNIAAQVFSQRVSAAMRFLANHNILPKECLATAEFLLMMDKLFDSFNGHSYQNCAKVFKGCLKQCSPHFQLWNELLPILKSMGFKTVIKNKTTGTTEIKYVQVPSLKNWIHNINVFKEMFTFLQDNYSVTSLLTRNFCQDPLENFFGNIRSNGIRNNSPTCSQFVNAFKTLLVNNYTSPHAVGANCEYDNNKPLQSLKYMLTYKNVKTSVEHNENLEISSFDELLSAFEQNSESTTHSQAKSYVAGYIMKKAKTKVSKSCHKCRMELSDTTPPQPNSFIFERDLTKKSLQYPSTALCDFLNEVYVIVQTCLRENPKQMQLKQQMVLMCNIFCNMSFLSCQDHKEALYKFMVNLTIDVVLHSWCTNVNRIMKGKLLKFDNNDLIKVQAENYYKLHRNKK